MLKLKKTSSTKNIVYGLVLSVLFIVTVFVVYRNYFSQPTVEGPTAIIAEQSEDGRAIDSISVFSESELDFLQSRKFKGLRDNFTEIKVEESGNKNLFVAPKKSGSSRSGQESGDSN